MHKKHRWVAQITTPCLVIKNDDGFRTTYRLPEPDTEQYLSVFCWDCERPATQVFGEYCEGFDRDPSGKDLSLPDELWEEVEAWQEGRPPT